MRYLKKFNESVNINIEVLEKLCTDYLAYLLDDAKLDIVNRNDIITISLDFTNKDLKWIDIKDVFIPFLSIINSEYHLMRNIDFYINRKHIDRYGTSSSSNHVFSVPNENVLNDTVESIGGHRSVDDITFNNITLGIIK